jgi:hypothetical protein
MVVGSSPTCRVPLDELRKPPFIPRMLQGLVRVLLFFFTLSVFVPWTVPLPPDDLDSSWMLALQWAHFHHIQFGRQIVFTYGPWGYALAGHAEAIFPWVVGVWTFLGVAFFLGIWKLANFATPNRWAGLFWMFVTIVIGGGAYTQMQDVRLFAMSWLLLLLHFWVDDHPWRVSKLLLSAAMALACLIKFSMLFAIAPVLAAITIDQIVRRRFPSYLLVFIFALLGFWLWQAQSIGNLWPFFHNSLRISAGYVDGEPTTLPTEALDVTLYVIAAGLLLAAIAIFGGADQSYRARRWVQFAAVFVILWVNFKAGYVRHDLHEILATSALALFCVLCAAAVWARARHWACRTFVFILSIGMIGLAWASAYRNGHILAKQFVADSILSLPSRAEVAVDWLSGAPLQTLLDKDLQAAYATPVPHVDGSVDIYSWGQGSLLLNGSDYDPRPVFQSFLAYTSALSKLNADFLTSPNAPQNVLFDLQPIDDHYPSEEDAQSWPELLARYEPVDAGQSKLILRQLPHPGRYSIVPIQKIEAQMGHWFPVPESTDPIWVTLNVRPTIAGRSVRMMYKMPPLVLGIGTRSGDVESYRFLADVAAGGFLLSPRIWERLSFAEMYSSNWKRELGESDVVQLVLSFAGNPTGYCYHDEIDVTFSRLEFQHLDISKVPGMAAYVNLREWFRKMKVVEAKQTPELVSADNGKTILTAAAPSRMIFPISPGTKTFKFSYGMLNSSFMEWEITDGVEFRVYTIDRMDAGHVHANLAWSRFLDPGHVRRDAGLQTGEITLPQSPVTLGVMLETVPGPKHLRSWSYWADFAAH